MVCNGANGEYKILSLKSNSAYFYLNNVCKYQEPLNKYIRSVTIMIFFMPSTKQIFQSVISTLWSWYINILPNDGNTNSCIWNSDE